MIQNHNPSLGLKQSGYQPLNKSTSRTGPGFRFHSPTVCDSHLSIWVLAHVPHRFVLSKKPPSNKPDPPTCKSISCTHEAQCLTLACTKFFRPLGRWLENMLICRLWLDIRSVYHSNLSGHSSSTFNIRYEILKIQQPYSTTLCNITEHTLQNHPPMILLKPSFAPSSRTKWQFVWVDRLLSPWFKHTMNSTLSSFLTKAIIVSFVFNTTMKILELQNAMSIKMSLKVWSKSSICMYTYICIQLQ